MPSFAFWFFCLPRPKRVDKKFAFWVFCLPEIQGPNLGCKVCILGLHVSSACLKNQGPNLRCKVFILGLLPA